MQSVDHLRQMFVTGKFQKYDFGPEENMARYGTKEPPVYNLDNISDFHIWLVGGKTDLLASVKDYTRVRDELAGKNKVKLYEYDVGHLGLVIPEDKKIMDELFGEIMAVI